jgi:uncharacterized Fe-S cluster-containing MiaB family protein
VKRLAKRNRPFYNVLMNDFIEKILQTLKNNGFPQKRVSLPTERMYEAADNKGFSFNQVLEQLKVAHQVEAQIGTEKIIFSQTIIGPLQTQEDMIRQAQEMMSQMDPEELKKLQEMFTNMSAEQKEEILKKGKDLGLI